MADLQEQLDAAMDDCKQAESELEETTAMFENSERDWTAIQETLHLLAVPSMGESIKAGIETPLNECSDEMIVVS